MYVVLIASIDVRYFEYLLFPIFEIDHPSSPPHLLDSIFRIVLTYISQSNITLCHIPHLLFGISIPLPTYISLIKKLPLVILLPLYLSSLNHVRAY